MTSEPRCTLDVVAGSRPQPPADRPAAATGTTMDRPLAPARLRIGLADAHRWPLRVAIAPLASLIALLADAYHPRGHLPGPWRDAIRQMLPARAREAVAPVVDPRTPAVPNCLIPMPEAHLVPLADDLDRIVTAGRDVLLDELELELGPQVPGHWQPVARQPLRWVGMYAAALQRAGDAVTPLWTRAEALLEREVERVGAAAARGALAELLAGVHPEARVEDGALVLPDYHDTLDLHVGSAGLVLIPMLTGTHRIIVQHRGDELTHIAYPLPGRNRLLHVEPDLARPTPDALEALVGPARARVLRHLDRPTTAGDVADALLAVPSAATRHVTVLEEAGLVARERQGRNVVVRRTVRGTQLLALYDG